MSDAPSDQEVVDLLRRQDSIGEVVSLTRQPYRYATSAPLEELRVETADGAELELILKDLSRDRLLDEAAATKPEFLHRPERELETYRRILAPAGIGPRCFGVVAESNPPRHWLVIEKVPGVELWQIGELSVWEDVAGWLGGLHADFAGRLEETGEANPHLLDLSDEWFGSWCRRAVERLADSEDHRAESLRRALDSYDDIVSALSGLPRTFVHGELYPSNVLVVQGDPSRICPVDWEMAGIGPGLIDLAALVGGWDDARRHRLIAAYLRGSREAPEGASTPEAVETNLARCRLHLALQWLGWSADWRPPPEHAHDWLGEALELAGDLGLVGTHRG
jgi:aminoglycoside phosphotransferase (APT) family kinase protein